MFVDAHRSALTNISTETTIRTPAISIFSHFTEVRAPQCMPRRRTELHAEHGRSGEHRNQLTVTVVDHGAGGRGDADHERAGGRRARIGMPHHALRIGTLMTPPPTPSSDDTLPAMNEANSATGMRFTR